MPRGGVLEAYHKEDVAEVTCNRQMNTFQYEINKVLELDAHKNVHVC